MCFKTCLFCLLNLVLKNSDNFSVVFVNRFYFWNSVAFLSGISKLFYVPFYGMFVCNLIGLHLVRQNIVIFMVTNLILFHKCQQKVYKSKVAIMKLFEMNHIRNKMLPEHGEGCSHNKEEYYVQSGWENCLWMFLLQLVKCEYI